MARPSEAWLPYCGLALLFAAHWFYSALVSDTSMLMDLVAAGLVVVAVARPRVREDLLRLSGLELPFLLFVVVLVVAAVSLTPWTPGGPHPVWSYLGLQPGAATIDRSATAIEIVKLLGLACFFVIGAATGGNDERGRFALTGLVALGAMFGLWAFIASVTGLVYQPEAGRLEAHFLNPNTAGSFFAVLLLIGSAVFINQLRRRRSRDDLAGVVAAGLALLVFAACLLDTASRGAVLALLGGFVLFFALQLAMGSLKLDRMALAALGVTGAVVVLVAVGGEQVVGRFFNTSEDAVARLTIWKLHWAAVQGSPLFGYGLGSAETINKTLLSSSTAPDLWNIRAILNLYLQWLEEAGVVGAAPMFLCIAAILFATIRASFRRTRNLRMLAALLGADGVILLHSASDFGLQAPSVAAFWAWLLGLQFSLAQGSSRR